MRCQQATFTYLIEYKYCDVLLTEADRVHKYYIASYYIYAQNRTKNKRVDTMVEDTAFPFLFSRFTR